MPPPPLPPVDDEYADDDPPGRPVVDDERRLQGTKPPRTPPSLHPRKAKDFLGQLENSLRNTASRAGSRGQSFEDFEREQAGEESLLDSLEETVSAPIAAHILNEQLEHTAFRDLSDTNGFDFEAEKAAGLDVDELSDDDFPTTKDVGTNGPQSPAVTLSSAENDENEYLAYGDEDDSDDAVSSGSSPERVILSIDLDHESGPAELEVRLDTIPAAAALAFLQQHGLPPEYFEPLVRQMEQLQEALRLDRAEHAATREPSSAAHTDHLLVDLSVNDVPHINAQGKSSQELRDSESPIVEQAREVMSQKTGASSSAVDTGRRQFHAALNQNWNASMVSESAPPALSLSVLSTGSAARASKGTQTPPLSPKDLRGDRMAGLSSPTAAEVSELAMDGDRFADDGDEVDLLEELDASLAEDYHPSAASVSAAPALAPVRRSSLLPMEPRSAQQTSTSLATKVFEEYRRPEPQNLRLANGGGMERDRTESINSDGDNEEPSEDREEPAWPPAAHPPQRVGHLFRKAPPTSHRDNPARVSSSSTSLDLDHHTGPPGKGPALGGMVMRKKVPAALGADVDVERSRAPYTRPISSIRDGHLEPDEESTDTYKRSHAQTPGRTAIRSSGEVKVGTRPLQQNHIGQATKTELWSPVSSPISTAPSPAAEGRAQRERFERNRGNPSGGRLSDQPASPSVGNKKVDRETEPTKGGSGFFSSFLRSKHNVDAEPKGPAVKGKSTVPAFLGVPGSGGGGGGSTTGAKVREKGGRSTSTARGTEKIDLL